MVSIGKAIFPQGTSNGGRHIPKELLQKPKVFTDIPKFFTEKAFPELPCLFSSSPFPLARVDSSPSLSSVLPSGSGSHKNPHSLLLFTSPCSVIPRGGWQCHALPLPTHALSLLHSLTDSHTDSYPCPQLSFPPHHPLFHQVSHCLLDSVSQSLCSSILVTLCLIMSHSPLTVCFFLSAQIYPF